MPTFPKSLTEMDAGTNDSFGNAAARLMDAALGKIPADLVVINARVLNVFTGELPENCGICVKDGKVAYVGTGVEEMADSDTHVIDAGGMTVIPGFIDGHTHMAASLVPEEFLKYAMTGGTTTIVTEVFEGYFAAGLAGVTDYLAACREQPIKIFATAPAMVSISSLSAGIDTEDLQALLSRPEILGMGEAYWQEVLQHPERYMAAFEMVRKSGKTLEGHTAGASEQKLAAYLAAGISSCHEPISAEEALSRLRQGLYVMIREGSVRKDLEAVSEIRHKNIDLRRAALVSDGITPEALSRSGYMETIVQKAIDLGFAPVDAIRMATLNVAEHFRMDLQIGAVAPGRDADFVLIPDISTICARCVVSRGKVIAENGKLLVSPRPHVFAQTAYNTVRLPRDLDAADFAVTAPDLEPVQRVRVMEMVTDLVTREKIMDLPVINGGIAADPENDIAKAAAVNFRQDPGRCFTGLVKGFGIKAGAMAASGAWDTSDLVAVGVNDADMAAAINRVSHNSGGIVAVKHGRVIGELALPVLGVMTEQPMADIIEANREIKSAASSLGIGFPDPVLSLLTLTGAAIPFIRLCEQGLVDLKTGQHLDLFA
ncbi:adenine deaminase [Desulfosalsimonas propionicica]|uniref:adenine deaminase n=1 Tax=Desulfosalsimonas propionicica TaxID=332175 RepID=A0A7W0C8C2_9BACT|nr:adenine deaminase C-terminal domain-containing protein [Desulfosalsimonas propionicica]MBA2881007.1 adenine deaminase [Desulfosalsimonas propionicica]